MMYLKLVLRNTKRSMLDYILYILSMVTLTSILCFSNNIANWGNMQAGFQTMALPILIVVIMIVLGSYINIFLVRQRAKEFATYMLLGMDKNKLSFVFLCELLTIGLICFLLGLALGVGVFSAFYYMILQETGKQGIIQIILKSNLQTLAYFCCVEILSIFFMKQRIYKLQIVQLMSEKQRNQPLGTDKTSFWWWIFLINFIFYTALLSAISFMPHDMMSVSISFIALPMIVCIFSFYKWLYAFIASLRLSLADSLYQGSNLYLIAQITTSSKTSAVINTIFCVCLIFSAVSFVFGMLLFNPQISMFEQTQQQWMAVSQISICIIFMTIYFYIFSLLQIVDLKKEWKNIRLLFYMGKNRSELKSLFCTQILIRLFLPTLISFIMLLTATPFINYKLNLIFPTSMCNQTVKAISSFMICFFTLYACYFCVTYIISTRYVKRN